MLHLLASDFSRMVFEYFRNYFHKSANEFFKLFQLYSHITHGHIPPQIAHVFGATHLLTMIKPSNGVHPSVMGEVMS